MNCTMPIASIRTALVFTNSFFGQITNFPARNVPKCARFRPRAVECLEAEMFPKYIAWGGAKKVIGLFGLFKLSPN